MDSRYGSRIRSVRIRVYTDPCPKKNYCADPYWFMKYCHRISISKGAEWFSKKFYYTHQFFLKKKLNHFFNPDHVTDPCYGSVSFGSEPTNYGKNRMGF
jgi:hypothetical protein